VPHAQRNLAAGRLEAATVDSAGNVGWIEVSPKQP